MGGKRNKSAIDAATWRQRAAAWLAALDLRRRGLWWRAGITVAAVLVLAFGLRAAGARLEAKVEDLPRFDRPLALEWAELPDWLQLPANHHVLQDLTRRVGLSVDDQMLDRSLAERVGRRLSAPEIGWIESVERVAVRPDGVVSVACRFRRPAAWVRQGKHAYLVDTGGVRLPGRYRAEQGERHALMTIAGVAARPAAVGQSWPGEDLASALRLVALLENQAYRHQIAYIDVANHGGRRNGQRPHVELRTDRKDARVQWGRGPDEESGREITARQKLALLETLYRQWGRIDMNRAYVDITTWPDRVAMPAPQGSERSRNAG